jgi:hypothetical protein
VIQLAKILFSEGKVSQKEVNSVEECINRINNQREWIHEQNVDDLLEFFEEVGKFWAKKFSNEIGLNSKHLTSFLSKSHLEKKLDISLHGNRNSLEQFVDLSDPELMFHAQPRGLVVHWIAGNVEILGIFSVLQALITKNVSIIKAPSKYELLIKLIESLKYIKTSKINGSKLVNCIEIVYVNRDDIKNQELLSMEANIRIAWGGEDAVNSIVSLPKSPFTEDIIYGPKYSYSIIDEESLKNQSDKIAQRIAVDVSMFDQYACSSPHTILVDTENEQVIEEFSKKLAKSLDDVNRILIPKGESNPEKSLEIIDVRTEYGLKGKKVLSSNGTEWTVIVSNETTLANPTFSRVIHVRKLDLEGLLKENISRKIQTISMEIEQKKRFKLIDRLTLLAGDRCPNVGTASLFDSPWDGIFGMDRMVRWITTYKNKEN